MSLHQVATTEMETDIAVVGYGGGGAIAAISAYDKGARVILRRTAA